MIKINGFSTEQGRLSDNISITGQNVDKLWFESLSLAFANL